MREIISGYAHDLNGDKRLRPPEEIESVYSLAEFMGRRGVPRWQEVNPGHYEAYLRSIEPVIRDPADPRFTQAVVASRRSARFMDYLADKEVLPESPADRIHLNTQGLVVKYDDTHPEFDGPINDFCSRRRSGRDPIPMRGHLRVFSGYLLTKDVKFIRDITPDHAEAFARDRIERTVQRRKVNFGGVQATVAANVLFFDYAQRKGLVKTNPFEGLYVTGKGQVFSPAKVPLVMQNTLGRYEKTVLAASATSTRGVARSYLRDMMHHVCSNAGIKTWAEMQPEHYEQFLRDTWGRWSHHPEVAQHRHAICSAFLDHQLARSPAKGFNLTLTGHLTTPKNERPEKLKEQAAAEAIAWKGIPGMRPGFEEEANAYRKRFVANDGVSGRLRLEQVLREFSAHLADRGVKNWKQVTPDDIAVFGRDLLAQKGVATAAPQFGVVKLFMADLEENGVRKDDPSIDFRMRLSCGFTVPSPVNPRLIEQADQALWRMHPDGSGEGSARKAYREIMRPLMAAMTKEGMTDWSDLTHERLKRYSNEELAATHSAALVQDRITIRLFCDGVYGPGPNNPANNMFKKGKREQRHYGYLLREGEDPLHIPKLKPPALEEPQAPRPTQSTLGPGD